MQRLVLSMVALVLVPATADAEDRKLTGVSADVSRYRVGKTTVCRLGEPPTCVEMSVKRQKQLKLTRPKKGKPKRTKKLGDGRTIEVRIATPSRVTGCLGLGTADRPPDCGVGDLDAMISPPLEVVVRDPDGNEVQLVVDVGRDVVLRDGPPEHFPGTILHVVFSKDGTRVVAAYQSSEMVVVGWDLSDRLAATAAP